MNRSFTDENLIRACRTKNSSYLQSVCRVDLHKCILILLVKSFKQCDRCLCHSVGRINASFKLNSHPMPESYSSAVDEWCDNFINRVSIMTPPRQCMFIVSIMQTQWLLCFFLSFQFSLGHTYYFFNGKTLRNIWY